MIQETLHTPVLYEEMLTILDINSRKKNIIVDCTLGLGGHAIGVLRKLNPGDVFIGIDADNINLQKAKENIELALQEKLIDNNIDIYYINSNFAEIKTCLNNIGINKITHIYYDFGVSSVHFDLASLGFSFRFDGPLDMRFDRTSGKTAFDVINTYSEQDLKNILYKYGEEPKTVFIVTEIIKRRKIKPIETTFELLDIIGKSSYDPKSKTRVFQAIRMEVNDELNVIEKSLSDAIGILDIGGIMACITFHSLEDKLVKNVFRGFCEKEIDDITGQTKKDSIAIKINKKPIFPTDLEIQKNSRSRSAKLRSIQKINNS